jgi:hypothetical protein
VIGAYGTIVLCRDEWYICTPEDCTLVDLSACIGIYYSIVYTTTEYVCQVAEKFSQQNREAGANPAQSRYCNWYAVSLLIQLMGHRPLFIPNGKAGEKRESQEPGDLPGRWCSRSFAS